MYHAHALATTSAGRLDQYRVTDAGGEFDVAVVVLRERSVGTGHTGHTGLFHGMDGGDLVAHEADGLGARADEDETALFHAFGEVGVFRQEAVARVDGDGVGHFRRTDDRGHIQVAVLGGGRPDAHRLIGELDVFSVAVSHRVQAHGLDAEGATRPLDTQGDFAAIGYDNFFNHGWRSGVIQSQTTVRHIPPAGRFP